MVYTVTLNPALDYVMKTPALSSGVINRSEGERLYYGGKGINVSAVLTRLGTENTALGFAAGFTGRELEAMLRADGISCDFCYLESGSTRINVKIKADTELDINAQGPSVGEKDVERLLKKLSSAKQGDYIVLSGSAPETLPPDIYERILKSLDGRGIKAVVDAEGEMLLNALKYKPFLVKPNHIELGDTFGEEADSDEAVVRLANRLRARGAENVLVSRAEKGAILVDADGAVYKTEAPQGRLVNSTGCGDSMVAGFLSGRISSESPENALLLATACGSATAFSGGLATLSEIEAVKDKMKNNGK